MEEELTDVEKQSIIVCAWRLDCKISAEKYVESLDKLVLLAKQEGTNKHFKEIKEKVSIIFDILTKPKKDEGKLDLPEIMKDPTVCVYGCGEFDDLEKHYKEVHNGKSKRCPTKL